MLPELFGEQNADDVTMAARAAGLDEDPVAIAASLIALMAKLQEALERRSRDSHGVVRFMVRNEVN